MTEIPHPMAAQLAGAPVPWQAWDQAAVVLARQRDLPLAVLVGDSLDAWTATWINAIHADRDLVRLLAEAFVPVAAERNEHPALAALAQQVLALQADASGVPCILVLLPGQPPRALGGVPYGPVRDEAGRKGLARVLLEVAQTRTATPTDLIAESERLHGVLAGIPFALGGGKLVPTRALELAEAQLMAEAHALEGGFGAAPDGKAALPRWPRPEALRLLALRANLTEAAPSLRVHLKHSLTALAAGGIHDQLGGGFHRASADANWTEPLWEQRLGDQARIARAFLDGHQRLGNLLFREVAERALSWATLDLALGGARWASGRHALSGGADGSAPGAYQRWSLAQAAAIVGSDGARILAQRFGLGDTPGPLAIRNSLEPDAARRLPELVARLGAARCERQPPPLDRREDLAAHGHLLGALHAAASLPDPAPDLVAARDLLLERLTTADPGRSRPRDLAAVALGLAEADEPETAARWLAAALASAQGGLFPWDPADTLASPTPLDAEDTVDGPSAAACAALALVRLGRHDEAMTILRAHTGMLMRAPSVACGMCLALTGL